MARHKSKLARQLRKQPTIPAIGDPFWPEFCRPLLVYILAEDRKWEEVTAWAKEKGVNGFFLRNALAWLEDKGYVETFLPKEVRSTQGAWVWRALRMESTTKFAKGSD